MTIEELKLSKQWVNCNYKITKDSKKTKVPISYNGQPTGTNKQFKPTWTAQIHSSIGVSKNDKTYTYTFNNNSSKNDITVSATTAAGQTTTIKSSQLVN